MVVHIKRASIMYNGSRLDTGDVASDRFRGLRIREHRDRGKSEGSKKSAVAKQFRL